MDRTVWITGASSGIGAAAVARLARNGFRVFGSSRRPEPDDAQRELATWVPMDVCDDASVSAAAAQVLSTAPRLDGVVCAAGDGIFGSVEEVGIEAARGQLETNFFGVLRTVRAVLPSLRQAKSGRIVVVGSLAGRAPIPFQAHYSASKAAVDALCLALRNELEPHGVAVSLVEPGDIHTAFNDRTRWQATEASPYGDRIRRSEEVIRELLPKAPGPEIVARVIERALTARYARVRYAVGPDSWLVPLGRRLLPDRLVLRLIRSQYRL